MDIGPRILIVDDEPAIRRVLTVTLERHGYTVQSAASGTEALQLVSRWRPDLILLDLGLPDIDGLDVIRLLREHSATPIIVLSVREAEAVKIQALEHGADDYITKPFSIGELVARLRATLRRAYRTGLGSSLVVRCGSLVVDLERRQVFVNGQEVRLTPTEYALLKTLVTHPNRPLTDRFLLQQVWGPDVVEADHGLHVYIARLRKKIEPDPQHPTYIRTEPGIGYRFVIPEERAPQALSER